MLEACRTRRVTKRVLRIGGWIAAAAATLLIACGVVLSLLFDPNDYRDDIERAFLDRTGRELRLEGELGLRLLPRLAVRTGPFSVANAPGFGAQPLLAAADARLDLRLWPLLSRRLEIGRVELDAPRVNLQVDAQGRDNWHSLFERHSTVAREPALVPKRSAPTSFEIAGLRVASGQVVYDDRASGAHYELSALTLATGTVASARPVHFDLGFEFATQPRERPRSVKLKASLAHPAATAWKLGNLEGEMRWPVGPGLKTLPIAFTADAASYDSGNHRFELPSYTLEAAGAKASGSLAGTVGQPATALSGPLNVERANLRKILPAFEIPLPVTRDETALESLRASAQLGIGAQGVALDALDGRLDDTKFSGAIRRSPTQPAAIGFALQLDRLDADRYRAPPEPRARADSTSAPADRGSPDALRTLRAAGTVAIGQLHVSGLDLRDVRGKLRAHDGRVTADPLRARIFDGESVTRLVADLRGAKPALEIDQRLSDIDVASMLRQTVKSDRLTGRGTVAAHVLAVGSTAAQVSDSLHGSYEIRVVDGSFSGVDLWNEIERGVAVAQGKAPPVKPATPRTPYDEFSAHGHLSGAVIEVQRFDVVNDFLKARGSGTIDRRAAACDLNLVATLLHTPEGEVAGESLAQLTGLDVGVTVRGPLDDPKVRPDVGSLLEAATKHRLRDEGQKVEKKVKDKVEEALRGLLGQ